MGYNNAKNEMKSIEKIQKAIEQLNNIVSWTKDDPDTSVAAEMAAKLLREVIADNTQVKKTELSVKEFVGKDSNLRPLMCCIFHDPEEHVAVATDAHAVFVNAAEYIETEGNHLRDVYGDNEGWIGKDKLGRGVYKVSEMGGRYPNWQAVMRIGHTPVIIRDDIEQAIKDCKAEMKATKRKIGRIRVSANGNIWMCVKFAEYIVRAGVDGWDCNAEKDLENGNRGIIKRWDGKQLLLMPMLMLDSHDNRLTTDEEEARGWQAAEE